MCVYVCGKVEVIFEDKGMNVFYFPYVLIKKNFKQKICNICINYVLRLK